MKNLLLSALLAIAAVPAVAQTSESPIVIHEGTQSLTGLSTYASNYLSYEATEDQFVTITGIENMLYVSNNSVDVASYYSSRDKINCFLIPANTEYKMYFYSDDTELNITVTATPKAYTDGTSIDNPVIASEEPFFVPFIKRGGWMSPATTIYIKYTAPMDGRLNMNFTTSVSNFKYSDDNGATFTDVPDGTSSMAGVDYSIVVDENQEYIFSGQSAYAMMASFTTSEINPGQSCVDAMEMKNGANTLPEEEGTYWFQFTTPATPAECFAVLTSQDDLSGVTSTLYSSCGGTGLLSQTGELHLRMRYSANTTRIIEMEKSAVLSAPATINLTFEMEQPYDAFSTAPTIEADETVTTPDFGGTYYYSITAPASGNYFLNVSTSETDLPYGTKVEIFASTNENYNVANGTSSARYNVEAGKSYVIKWTCPDKVRALPFTASFTEVQQGETAGDPITAVLGENTIPAFPNAYFLYTATEDSWLLITPADATLTPTVIEVESAGDTGSSISTFKDEDAYRFQAANGKNYQISFSNVAAASSFTLAVKAFEPGETSAYPLEAVDGVAALPDKAGTTWVSYTATKDGLVDVTTNVTYNWNNTIRIYLGEVEGNNDYKTLTSSSSDYYKYEVVTYDLKAGQKLIISASLASAQDGAEFTFTEREPNPGEFISSAIEIDFSENPMEYEFDKTATYDKPVWYSINLNEGIFNIESNSDFTMYLYAEDDTENEIAKTSYSYSAPYKLENAVIPATGRYYLKLISNNTAFTATISERDPQPGETPATAKEINPTSQTYEYDFGRGESDSVNELWFSINLQPGEFKCVFDSYISAALYKEGNLTSAVADSSYDSTESKYMIKYTVPEVTTYSAEDASKYYIKVSNPYVSETATLSGSALNITTGVTEIGVDAVNAEYFNLEGIRIESPQHGQIVIRKTAKGATVMKF